MRKVMMSMAAMALACGTALAADPTLDVAKRCVQVKDSLERLVCFDRAFAGVSAAPAAPAAPAARAVPAPAPAAVAPAAVAPPAVAAAPREMGDEQIKRSTKEREKEAGPTSLTANVSALKETRRDVFRISLDNGQVWQQMDMETLFHIEVGDTVQIDKGALGGYRMARVSGSRSGWVRVNRVK